MLGQKKCWSLPRLQPPLSRRRTTRAAACRSRCWWQWWCWWLMFMLMIKMTVSVCCVLGGRGGRGAAYKWDSRVWEPTPLSFHEPWLDLTALLIIFKVKPDQRHQVEMATIDHPCVKKVDQRKKNCICKISNNSLPGARTLGIPRWQEVHSPRWQEETFTPSSFPPVIRSRPPPAPYPWENFPSQCAANVSPSTLQFADVSGQYVHREEWYADRQTLS